MRTAAIVVLGACSAVPPPPLVPFHSTTAPEERGETSAMLIVGGAGEPLGFGFGAAVRFEHQTTDRTAIGFDVTVGRGYDTTEPEPTWFVGVRGFGRTNIASRDWAAVTYGAGLSYLDSGNLSASLQLGGAVAATNETFVPYATLGIAPVLVLRRGRAYSMDASDIGNDEDSPPDRKPPRSDVFLAYAIRRGAPLTAVSLAGRQ